MNPTLIEHTFVITNETNEEKAHIIMADISRNTEDFEGHFGILPMNTLVSLVQACRKNAVRSKISVTIDQAIASGKTIKVDLGTGAVSLQLSEGQEQIGSMKFPSSDAQEDEDLMGALSQQVEALLPTEHHVFNENASQSLPHKSPFITIEDAMSYSDLESKQTSIVGRTTMPDDSPFHGPEMDGEKENMGFLCEFAAQTGALFLNDPDNEIEVNLTNLKFTPLSKRPVEEGTQIECFSLQPPEKGEGNKRAKLCKFALVAVMEGKREIIGYVEITGICMPKSVMERTRRKVENARKEAEKARTQATETQRES